MGSGLHTGLRGRVYLPDSDLGGISKDTPLLGRDYVTEFDALSSGVVGLMVLVKDGIGRLSLVSVESLKLHLWSCVDNIVRGNWRKYYYQYCGLLEDLVGDIYADFISLRGRVEKRTLIDGYDCRVMSFESYVKCCVLRKLIDRSRSDGRYFERLDDLVVLPDRLVESVDLDVVEGYDLDELRCFFVGLAPVRREYVLRFYKELRGELGRVAKEFFDGVFGYRSVGSGGHLGSVVGELEVKGVGRKKSLCATNLEGVLGSFVACLGSGCDV